MRPLDPGETAHPIREWRRRTRYGRALFLIKWPVSLFMWAIGFSGLIVIFGAGLVIVSVIIGFAKLLTFLGNRWPSEYRDSA